MSILSELLVRVGADISGFSEAMGSVASSLDGAGEKMAGAGDAVEKLNEKFDGIKEGAMKAVEALGLTFSAYELLKHSFEEYASIEKAELALTALTGDAETAHKTIEDLRDMALAEGLDFPALVTAAQRMVAFGFTVEQTQTSLQSIADAAAATNKPIDSVASAFDRIVESGNISAKMLFTLGLNLGDLGNVMGITGAQATTAFKALDQSDKIEILQAALDKYKGTAVALGDGLEGSWNKAKLSVTTALEEIGAALAPAATNMLNFLTTTVSLLEKVLSSFDSWISKLGDVASRTAGLPSSAATTILSIATGTAFGQMLGPIGGGKPAPGAPTSGVGSTTDSGDTLAGAGLSASAQAAIIQAQLTAAFQDAQKNLQIVSQAYKDGLIDVDAYTAAQMRVTAAFAALHPNLVQIGYQFGDLQPTMAQLTANSPTLESALKALGITAADGGDKIAELEANMSLLEQAYHSGQITQAQYDEATQHFVKSMQSLQGAFEATTGPVDMFSTAAAEKLDDALGGTMQENALKMAAGLVALGDKAATSVAGINTLDGAMKTLGETTFTDAVAKAGYLQSAFDSLSAAAGIGVPLAAQKAADALMALDKATLQLSGDRLDEQRLGVPDLTTLGDKLDTDNDAYNRLATDGAANMYQLLEAKRQVLIDQINYTQQLGGNTSDLKVQLDHLNASLQSQPTLWSTLQTAMKGVGDTLKTGLGTAFGDVLFNIGKVGDDFKKLGENMVDIILNKIVALGVDKLFNALASIGDGAGPIAAIGKALGGVATQASEVATSLGDLQPTMAQLTGAPGAAGGAAGTAAGGTSGAGSLGSSLSSITGMVTAVSSAVSAITGIISLFQGKDEVDRLNSIANATTRMAQIMDVQFLPWIGDMHERANYFYSYQFDGWFHNDFCMPVMDDLDGIHENTTRMDYSLQQIAAATAAQSKLPPVAVTVQGNVIGNQAFIDQLTQAIMGSLKVQGAVA